MNLFLRLIAMAYVPSHMVILHFLYMLPAGDDHNEFGVGGGWNGYRATKALAISLPT